MTAEITPTRSDEALPVLLYLRDGEEVAPARPGHPGTRHHFRRKGDEVLASVTD